MTQALQFKAVLLSAASNPIATRVLADRLEALRAELCSMEEARLESLEGVAGDLANERLLKHGKNGIQPRVASCLVDVLRLYAPNAPYEGLELERVLRGLMMQFRLLTDPEGKYYPMVIHVLETAAAHNLFALIAQTEGRNELVDLLFETLYGAVSSDKFENVLEPFVVTILNGVVGDPNVELSMKALKLVMNKFLANSKVRKTGRSHVTGFEVTLKLCQRNSEKLSRMVTRLMSELLYEAANLDDIDSDSQLDSDDQRTAVERGISKTDREQKAQLNKIHTLMIELWRYVPELLSSATGLLENELEADDVLIRTVATKALGHILAINSALNFTTTHPLAFAHWLKKPLDINPGVRRSWISQLAKVVENRPDLKAEMQFAITTTLIDSDERVRIATIYQLSLLMPSVFIDRVASVSIMKLMKPLVRDKHQLMRQETTKFLSTIYNSIIDDCEESQRELVDWIPDEIIKLVYINDTTIEADVDLLLFEKIIPFEQDSQKRVQRLLRVVGQLSKKSQTALFSMIKRQVQLDSVLTQLFGLMEEYNFDFTDDLLLQKITKVSNWLATRFPAKLNSATHFLRFFKLKNKRFFRLLTLCISTSSDYQTVTTGLKELLTKVSEPKNLFLEGESNADAEAMQSSMKLLMLRASSIWYNVSNVTILTDIAKVKTSPFNETALLILDNIAQVNPSLLKTNIDALIDATTGDANLDFRWRDLKAITNYIKKFGESFYSKIGSNEDFVDKLRDVALNGTCTESPYAVQILSGLRVSEKTTIFHELFKSIWPLDRLKAGNKYNTQLATLGKLFECDFLTVEADAKEIGKYLTDEILFKNYALTENDKEWIEDHEMDEAENYECGTKILAIELFSKWLKVETDDVETLNAMGKHIIHTFLSNIIVRGGEITREKDTPKRVQARLRLEACVQILDLGTHERFNELINETILQRLINCVQDSQEQVREGSLEKLKQLLTSHAISDKFFPLVYFVAHDPKKEIHDDMKIWIKAAYTKQTGMKNPSLVFEKSWVRFLHMLHNHFELKEYYEEWMDTVHALETLEGANEEDIADAKQANAKVFKELVSFASGFIVFLLNCVGTAENVSLFYYLAQRIKQTYDATSDTPSPEEIELPANVRLYFVSDLAQLVISEVAKLKNWNTSGFTGKLALPKDLYGTLSKENLQTVMKREYLPLECSEDAAMVIRGRWRLEASAATGNRTRRSEISTVDEAIDSQQQHKRKSRKRTAKVVLSDSESETVVTSDAEYTEKNGKKATASPNNPHSNGTRRSKRVRSAPPVDYAEN